MEAFIINRKLTRNEEDRLLELLNEKDQVDLYSNVSLPPALGQYSKGEIELTPEEKKAINYDILTRVIQFGEIKINNTTITDLFTFETVSIWHYHKFRIYFIIRNLFYETELIKKLRLTNDQVFYYGDNPLLKEFPFDDIGIQIKINQSKKESFSKKAAFNYSIFFLVRSLQGLFQTDKLKNKKHIVIDHSFKQTCLNLNTLKPEPGNYNLQYLFEKIDDQFIILNDVQIPKFSAGTKFTLNSSQFKLGKNKYGGEWILFRGYISEKIRKQLKKVSNQYVNEYGEIEKKLNDPFNDLIIRILKSLHSSSRLFLFKYLSYKRFFLHHFFKTISSIDENSSGIKSILDAAKASNVKTIGIQHGTIHELHPAYIYAAEDQQRNIVPDFTIVWGKYWSQFLIDKGHYKQGSLEIAGQIRTDIIPKLKDVRASDYLKIPDGSKIIVFASQPQRDPKLREQAAFDVFYAVKDLKNVQLVLKLHPAEKNDIDYYNKIAQNAGCKNYQIILDIDLYLLISVCDILITCFSTVGAETVYFNKPLIILDHLKQDIQGYHKEGIALQATNKAELKAFLSDLLSGKINYNKTAYKNYIAKYANKIDGKVAERIIEFIRNL